MQGNHGRSSARRLLPVLLLCFGSLAQAGFDPPTFREAPLESSTFYSAVFGTLLPLQSTMDPGEGSDLSSEASEESSDGSSSDQRRLHQAREDAALFVGSAGALRGVHLEAALQWLRQRPGSAGLDDLQLAAAILQRERRATEHSW